jgi:hypothetical protein
MKKLFLLGVIFSLVLSLGLVIACDDDDDDDNDTDADDDDTGGEWTCDDVYTAMYDDCGWAFQDAEGNEIAKEDVVAACDDADATYGLDGALAACIIEFVDDCDAMLDCIAGVIG